MNKFTSWPFFHTPSKAGDIADIFDKTPLLMQHNEYRTGSERIDIRVAAAPGQTQLGIEIISNAGGVHVAKRIAQSRGTGCTDFTARGADRSWQFRWTTIERTGFENQLQIGSISYSGLWISVPREVWPTAYGTPWEAAVKRYSISAWL